MTSGEVRRLTPAGSSYNLLAVRGDVAVAARSTPCQPPELVVTSVVAAASGQEWMRLPSAPRAAAVHTMLSGLSTETISLVPPGAEDPIDAVVLRPSKAAPSSPVLFLHG